MLWELQTKTHQKDNILYPWGERQNLFLSCPRAVCADLALGLIYQRVAEVSADPEMLVYNQMKAKSGFPEKCWSAFNKIVVKKDSQGFF